MNYEVTIDQIFMSIRNSKTGEEDITYMNLSNEEIEDYFYSDEEILLLKK